MSQVQESKSSKESKGPKHKKREGSGKSIDRILSMIGEDYSGRISGMHSLPCIIWLRITRHIERTVKKYILRLP